MQFYEVAATKIFRSHPGGMNTLRLFMNGSVELSEFALFHVPPTASWICHTENVSLSKMVWLCRLVLIPREFRTLRRRIVPVVQRTTSSRDSALAVRRYHFDHRRVRKFLPFFLAVNFILLPPKSSTTHPVLPVGLTSSSLTYNE